MDLGITPSYTTLTTLTLTLGLPNANANPIPSSTTTNATPLPPPPAEHPSVLAVHDTEYVLASPGDAQLTVVRSHLPRDLENHQAPPPLGTGQRGSVEQIVGYTVRWPVVGGGAGAGAGVETGAETGTDAEAIYPFLLQAAQPVFASSTNTSNTSSSTTTTTGTRRPVLDPAAAAAAAEVVGCHVVISRTLRIGNEPSASASTVPREEEEKGGNEQKKHYHAAGGVTFQLAGLYIPFSSAPTPSASVSSATLAAAAVSPYNAPPPSSVHTYNENNNQINVGVGGKSWLDVQWCIQAGEAVTYVRWLSGDDDGAPGAETEAEGKSVSRSRSKSGSSSRSVTGNGRWIIGGPEPFSPALPLSSNTNTNANDSSADAQRPVVTGAGDADRGTSAVRDALPKEDEDEDEEGQYPYSWTQTRDTVTVTFKLAFRSTIGSTSSTTTTTTTTAPTEANARAGFNPNSDLLIHLSPSTLDLRFPDRRPTAQQEIAWTPAQRMFFGVLDAQDGKRDWWDTVEKEGSRWAFEWVGEEGKESKGKLVIEVKKANEGVRWAAVFAPLQQQRGDAYVEEMRDDEEDEEDDDDDGMTMEEMDIDVPETLTQEQIDASRSGLEQWHTSASAQDDSVPAINRFAGLGAIPPSMMGEPMDDDLVEFDDDPAFSGGVAGEPTVSGVSGGGGEQGRVGTMMVFTQVAPASPCSERQGGRWDVSSAQADGVWVLSTELADGPSLVLKSHLDGHLFVPPRSPGSSSWQHRSTNPALSFVLASKRDTQYVHHLYSAPSPVSAEIEEGATVIAFEARQPNGMGGNAYVYWPVPSSGKTKTGKNAAEEGKQGVVKFGEADGGVLLGVTSVVVGGQTVVVGLCERQLVVLEGL
ncbi:hypothetical protein QFC24_006432 [Naganishia onofrii]|uniref:Uncharacterized protein n=1 Tax=Naganishia onofrii TaxID=1851511 RepID=A0ACC2X1S9_9TREE|nr:hypothetical protein QFC24_006432 [Naganishia onofrii]